MQQQSAMSKQEVQGNAHADHSWIKQQSNAVLVHLSFTVRNTTADKFGPYCQLQN
jgi:hypothetical protein